MSFAHDIREELAAEPVSVRQYILAEAAGIVLSCGHIRDGILQIETEHKSTAGRICLLLEEGFHIKPVMTVQPGRGQTKGRYHVAAGTEEESAQVLGTLQLGPANGRLYDTDLTADEVLLMRTGSRRAFLRGMFLGCGTAGNPEKSYHLEFACSGQKQADQVSEILARFSFTPRTVIRRSHTVVYLKEGQQVSDLLGVMEATATLLEFETIRVRREVSGRINRKVNCETANLGKTVKAGVSQVQDIRLIQEKAGLDSLPPDLREAALARLGHEDISLGELGALMDPPVGKSGMSHRFTRIRRIADSIRNKEE